MNLGTLSKLPVVTISHIGSYLEPRELLKSPLRETEGFKVVFRKYLGGEKDGFLLFSFMKECCDCDDCFDKVKFLLKEGAKVKNKFELKLLNWAIKKGYTDIVKLLLDAGADKDVKDKYGWTPLHEAAQRGQTNAVKLLLDAGADKDVKDKYGETPLHTAANSDRTDVVKLLLDAGADKEVKEKVYGKTALDYAEKWRYPDVIKLLKDKKVLGKRKRSY